MMATGHTSVAAAVTTATFATASALGLPIFELPQALAFTLVATGCSLLPDCDHPEGCVAVSLGPITGAPCAMAHEVHGHRGATHSITWAAIPGLVVGAATYLGGPVATGIVLGLSALWVLMAWPIARKLVRPRRRRTVIPWRWRDRALDLVVAAGIGLAARELAQPGPWLAAAVVAGCWLHLLGDAPTEVPFPWLWPFSRARWSAGWFPTGDPVEGVITVACCAVAVVAVAVMVWSAVPI